MILPIEIPHSGGQGKTRGKYLPEFKGNPVAREVVGSSVRRDPVPRQHIILLTQMQICIQVELNVSGEITKHGWAVRDEDDCNVLIQEFEKILEMPSLSVKGLMTMAPYSPNSENSRSCFRKLKEIRDTLSDRFPQENVLGLSMGMSGDFEVAIQEGATILRVGSAIVGER